MPATSCHNREENKRSAAGERKRIKFLRSWTSPVLKHAVSEFASHTIQSVHSLMENSLWVEKKAFTYRELSLGSEEASVMTNSCILNIK